MRKDSEHKKLLACTATYCIQSRCDNCQQGKCTSSCSVARLRCHIPHTVSWWELATGEIHFYNTFYDYSGARPTISSVKGEQEDSGPIDLQWHKGKSRAQNVAQLRCHVLHTVSRWELETERMHIYNTFNDSTLVKLSTGGVKAGHR